MPLGPGWCCASEPPLPPNHCRQLTSAAAAGNGRLQGCRLRSGCVPWWRLARQQQPAAAGPPAALPRAAQWRPLSRKCAQPQTAGAAGRPPVLAQRPRCRAVRAVALAAALAVPPLERGQLLGQQVQALALLGLAAQLLGLLQRAAAQLHPCHRRPPPLLSAADAACAPPAAAAGPALCWCGWPGRAAAAGPLPAAAPLPPAGRQPAAPLLPPASAERPCWQPAGPLPRGPQAQRTPARPGTAGRPPPWRQRPGPGAAPRCAAAPGPGPW